MLCICGKHVLDKPVPQGAGSFGIESHWQLDRTQVIGRVWPQSSSLDIEEAVGEIHYAKWRTRPKDWSIHTNVLNNFLRTGRTPFLSAPPILQESFDKPLHVRAAVRLINTRMEPV